MPQNYEVVTERQMNYEVKVFMSFVACIMLLNVNVIILFRICFVYYFIHLTVYTNCMTYTTATNCLSQVPHGVLQETEFSK